LPTTIPTRLPGAGAAAQALGSVLWLPQAAMLAMAVQRIADGGGLDAVLLPTAGIVAIGLARALCDAWGTRRLFAAARALLTLRRAEVAQALAARSPLDRSRPASGLAASAIAEQAEALMPWLVRYLPARWRVMLVPPVFVLAVGWFSWVAALVLLLAAPLIPLFMAIIGWRAKAASEQQMLQVGSMNAFLLDRLRGLATLRALHAVDATALRVGDAAASLRRRTMAVLRIAFLSSAVLELFAALGVAMVAVYVGFHLLGQLNVGAWGQRLSLGEGLFILLLAPAFFEPLRDLSAVWHDRAAGEAAQDALARLGRGGIELPGARHAGVPPLRAGAASVAIRHLGFAHPGETDILDDLSLTVAAGEHVALVGPSGSGKTVLLSLIAGLVPVQRGEIAIGGVPLTDATAAGLRARIGWIGQRPHVFCASVSSNVALWRSEVDGSAVREAIRSAGLEHVVQAHPAAALGEGGAGLSGGEAVRLALARVTVARAADLWLVDEPTAHLDADTARIVIDTLILLAQGKTMLVATHDPLLVGRLGRVVRLGGEPVREAA
jgi:ATP-binding cassette subfamily C protein CydD